MNCSDAQLLLQDYLDGELLSAQRGRIDEHLVSCAVCRHVLENLESLDRRLGEIGEIPLSGDLAGSVMSRLPEDPWLRRVGRTIVKGHPLVVLTFFMFALMFGVFSAYQYGNVSSATKEVEVILAYPGAQTVALTGDFNGWDAQGIPMTRTVDGSAWRVTVRVPKGVYHYNFVVDGSQFLADPNATAQMDDGFGGTTSVMVVEG